MTEVIHADIPLRQYRVIQALAKDALSGASVDYTGDTRDEEGNIVAETPLETCLRLGEHVIAMNPIGYQKLQNALGEV